MAANIGPKRLVVGAHYGLRDWLAQRITAVVMAAYLIVFGAHQYAYVDKLFMRYA